MLYTRNTLKATCTEVRTALGRQTPIVEGYAHLPVTAEGADVFSQGVPGHSLYVALVIIENVYLLTWILSTDVSVNQMPHDALGAKRWGLRHMNV